MAGLGMANEVNQLIQVGGEVGALQVYVQGILHPCKPTFLTIHDLGCNHYQYEDFVGHTKMSPIMQRAVWIHIDLPGQGDGEPDLPATTPFPPISAIPDAIKTVLDHFEIKQVVLFGEGAGANILARFAIKYADLVLGAILINCSATRASITESIKDKVSNWKLSISGMNAATESFLIFHRFGQNLETDNEIELKKTIENFRQNLRHSINAKNLNKFITAYMQRKNLSDDIAKLNCPILLVTGTLASHKRACSQMYEELTKSRQKSGDHLSTCNFILVDGAANVLTERPKKMIEVMQLFLQGLGLLSNLTIQKTPLQLNRRMSMEDYDRPTSKTQFTSQLTRRLSEEPDI